MSVSGTDLGRCGTLRPGRCLRRPHQGNTSWVRPNVKAVSKCPCTKLGCKVRMRRTPYQTAWCPRPTYTPQARPTTLPISHTCPCWKRHTAHDPSLVLTSMSQHCYAPHCSLRTAGVTHDHRLFIRCELERSEHQSVQSSVQSLASSFPSLPPGSSDRIRTVSFTKGIQTLSRATIGSGMSCVTRAGTRQQTRSRQRSTALAKGTSASPACTRRTRASTAPFLATRTSCTLQRHRGGETLSSSTTDTRLRITG